VDTVVAALAEQQAELSGLLAGLPDADWERPSRCEGWSVGDVVLHLCQTDEMAIASLEERLPAYFEALAEGIGRPATSVDEGADLAVAHERGRPPAEVRDRWQSGAEELIRLFETVDLHKRVDWVAGQLSTRTLAATRLAETWIHTGDVAAGLDVELPAGDRLRHIARLAWRTLPYAFARDSRELQGPVAFQLTGPEGDRWDFVPEGEPAPTTIRGDGIELCLVAARRVEPTDTGLTGEGPDAAAVLELVRTYA
jgi:uncharacterized protein (TIGR03084 family)